MGWALLQVSYRKMHKITSYQHFQFPATTPGTVLVHKHWNSEKTAISLLKRGFLCADVTKAHDSTAGYKPAGLTAQQNSVSLWWDSAMWYSWIPWCNFPFSINLYTGGLLCTYLIVMSMHSHTCLLPNYSMLYDQCILSFAVLLNMTTFFLKTANLY